MKALKLIPRMWILMSLLFTIHITAQNNIVGYEYAFNDGEGLQYVSITPTQDFNLVTDIDVSTLTNDVNVIHIRFLDENGLWSSIISKIFVKPSEAFVTASTIVGYEYGFDDDNPPTYVSITPTADFNLVTDFDVSSLTNDVNVFHIRFQDDIGQWSSVISKIFVKPAEAFVTASTIVGYEYGFDDENPPTYVPITPTADYNLVTDLDVSSLTNDVNVFYIRFKDDIGQWSSFISKIFVKPPEAFVTASTIVGYEYGFDDDNPPTYVSITPTADFNLVTDIDVSSLTNDVNVFHIRFQDDIGQWSSIISKIFAKPPDTFATASTIVGYEYSFDDDNPPTYVPITPTADFNLVADIDVSALTNDINVFNIRFKDDIGQWSSMISKIFVKPPEPLSHPDNKLVQYDYWFDDDMTTKVTVPIDPGQADFVLVADLDVTQIWAGEHTINTQFKDEYGNYSVVMTDTINKTVLPIASFISDLNSICVGETINFTNYSIDYDTVAWDFDDGNTSTDVSTSHTFNTAGTFDVSLTVTDSASTLDSIVTQSVQVYSYPVNTVTASEPLQACYGSTVTLTADDTDADYLWSNGATTQSIDVVADGTFSVSLTRTGSPGCSVVSSDYVITFDPEIDNSVTVQTEPSALLTANQAGASYQWIDCTNGNIDVTGETNQTFVPTIDGDYAVEVTINNCTVTSDCVTMTNLAVGDFELGKLIQLYPNPVEDIITVKTEIPLLIEIFSLNGVKIKSIDLNLGVNSIDLSRLKSGLYIFKAKESSTNSNYKHSIYKIIKD